MNTEPRNERPGTPPAADRAQQDPLADRPPAAPSSPQSDTGLAASRAAQERELDMMLEQTFPASDPLPGPGVI